MPKRSCRSGAATEMPSRQYGGCTTSTIHTTLSHTGSSGLPSSVVACGALGQFGWICQNDTCGGRDRVAVPLKGSFVRIWSQAGASRLQGQRAAEAGVHATPRRQALAHQLHRVHGGRWELVPAGRHQYLCGVFEYERQVEPPGCSGECLISAFVCHAVLLLLLLPAASWGLPWYLPPEVSSPHLQRR